MTGHNRRSSDHHFVGPLCLRIKHARRVARLSQAQLASRIGISASAIAQWELPSGTSPTVDHLVVSAVVTSVAFEWLATGRGPVGVRDYERPALDASSFAVDHIEDRLLAAFRRLPRRKRESFVLCVEALLLR